MIPFNIPCITGKEETYIHQVLSNKKFSGNGPFGEKCKDWLEWRLSSKKALLTPSCTAALEMAALLADLKAGDEVLMPSYTFVTTANAFVLRGATPVFIDIDPQTMNINTDLIEQAITPHTKAIVVVHYAGVSCDMDKVMDIAEKHGLFVIEDAAQALLSTFKGKELGTLGHFGTFSFHETKNYTCGEGGALLINDSHYIERAEIIQEKGTNRSQFKRGQVNKYTWQDIGSSYLLSELNAAYLLAQLRTADTIYEDRMESWNHYAEGLQPLIEKGKIDVQQIPDECQHNAHMFYIKTADLEEREDLRAYLDRKGIMAVPHYEPLHSSPGGEKYGRSAGGEPLTKREGERLLRLPLYYGMESEDVGYVVEHIQKYFKE
ncbi:dTDP-4-amino-4,6-dideoxygalactose transaminase [Halobacillus karajensis]|uniref:dTDP-4-amino-4,6-dideoxygalactose transaminase n=1 Tax=Halobacillus karajensis TaxID=195088 RepID=UPI0008A81525|nr:dTDP-4-amino-4,6-dideoxygalactose transaminase [Halobacillus karajensis]SEI02424.1 dTDP-4-amino-4,6-dideoxygalactose transaminase [Halobacillus karajensis]